MSSLGFDTQAVKNAYLGTGSTATALSTLRSSQSIGQELSSLDSRVEQFENAIVPTALPAGNDQSTYPYNQQGLMNQFLDEFVGLLYQQDQATVDANTTTDTNNISSQDAANTWANTNFSSTYVKKTTSYTATLNKDSNGNVISATAVNNDMYAVDELNSNDPAFVNNTNYIDTTLFPPVNGTPTTTIPADPNNAGNGLTISTALLSHLTTTGINLVKQYALYISSVYAQGNTLKNNPVDPTTGLTVDSTNASGQSEYVANVVAIPPIVINGVTYDHTASVNGAVVYLQQGTPTYTAQKYQIFNTNGQAYDVGVGFQPPGAGSPPTVPNDNFVIAYYGGSNENLSVLNSSQNTLTSIQKFLVPGITGGVHLGNDGNFYALTTDSSGNPVQNSSSQYTTTATWTPQAITPFLANGVKVDRQVAITTTQNGKSVTQNFYVAADNSKLIPTTLITQAEGATSESATLNITTTSTKGFSLPGKLNLQLGADGNFYSVLPVKDSSGNFVPAATYTPAQIPDTVMDGVHVNRIITVNNQSYYVATDNSQLILKSYTATDENSGLANGAATSTTLTEAFAGIPNSPTTTFTLHYATNGNLYTLAVDNNGQPLKDGNGNYEIGTTYTPTPINPVTLANGVLVNRTIQIGNQFYYLAADNSQLVPEPAHMGGNEVSATAITATGLTLLQEYALPAVPGGLHLASDGNFYSLHLDGNGNPLLNAQNQYQTGTEYTPIAITPMTMGGVTVNRSISVGGQTYYVASDNSEVVPATVASQSTAVTASAGLIDTTAPLTESYSVPNVLGGVHYSPNGNFYTIVTDINGNPALGPTGNYLLSATIVPTQIAPTTINGVPVNRVVTITDSKGNNQTYYVATDNSQLVLPVTTPPPVISAGPVRNMDIMEFIYYWNEAKMHVLKAQLAYQNDITQEMQNNLREANAAMADLEGQSSKTRQADNQNNVNPDSAPQTPTLHLFAVENETQTTITTSGTSTPTGTILPFGLATNPDNNNFPAFSMDNGQFQKARVGLQNYIDRRTADAQSAMVDYQNTLNTFNNNYNTMSQLQQTLEQVITQQLKNWVG
ncbi:MAG: hypothetical protein JO331_12125 [Verrucomicrobia bacterium]|nr:hypothetical protein [Verrucomicrobiota bacterium]